MRMKFLDSSTIPDYRNEGRRTILFALVLIANLVLIGCLLIIWNANAVSDDTSYAILLVGAVSGLFVLFFITALLICFATTSNSNRNIGVQTVYPTPDFQYFTGTMLNRVQQKNESISLQPFQGSAFSILSTRPATSRVSTITVSPPYNPNQSNETLGSSPPDYMRVY